jgi:hypothetical protein
MEYVVMRENIRNKELLTLSLLKFLEWVIKKVGWVLWKTSETQEKNRRV